MALPGNIKKIVFNNPNIPNNEVVWLNIERPGKAEIEYLRKEYNFSLAHLQASSAKSMAQRTAIENTDEYLFLILHFPVFSGDNIVGGEIDFFIGDDFIITLHNGNLKGLNSFYNSCKKANKETLTYRFESSAVLLYEILDKLMLECFTLLDKNLEDITELEDLIFAQKSKRAVSEILDLRRNVINTRRIMINHKNVIKKLIDFEVGRVPEHKVKKYYNSLLENSKRFWEYLDIQKEMVEILNSTNESFLNNRLNEIMKTLTIFSVIVFPLTLLAAIFGMNTVNGMPFMNDPNGFWSIIAIMLAGSLVMMLIFAKKKWL
jgi:magnesium transporter